MLKKIYFDDSVRLLWLIEWLCYVISKLCAVLKASPCFNVLFIGSATKNQILNAKCQQTFFVVVSIQKEFGV